MLDDSVFISASDGLLNEHDVADADADALSLLGHMLAQKLILP
jgi:hypothetical protein